MAYSQFDETKPDPTTQNGAQVCNSTRDNLTALRDMLLFGAPVGWDMSVDPANSTTPNKYIFTATSERVEISVTRNSSNLITSAVMDYYPATTGGTAENIGTLTFTYNSDDVVVSTAWS